MPGDEGAFLACSFWLADALVLDGQVDAGRAQFERLLALRNDVGLLAEEYDVHAGRQLGNVPQAYSHLALVNSALNLAQVPPRARRRRPSSAPPATADPVRLSVCLDPARPWADALALAAHAETVGLHGVWVCDHFMPYAGDGRPAAGPVLEGWTVLTAVAARTTRIRLGTLVLGASYRHPAVVAKMAATLDHVSDGRLTLGLGAGWQPNEHTAYGIELLPPAARLARLRGVRGRDPVVAARAEHHGGGRVVPADRRDLRPAAGAAAAAVARRGRRRAAHDAGGRAARRGLAHLGDTGRAGPEERRAGPALRRGRPRPLGDLASDRRRCSSGTNRRVPCRRGWRDTRRRGRAVRAARPRPVAADALRAVDRLVSAGQAAPG